MSSGYFYAYASKAGAKQSRPGWFGEDALSGEDMLLEPRILISTGGVWLQKPTVSIDADQEPAAFVTTDAGERSAPYVILSPEEDGPPGKLIAPAGVQGFS